MQWKGNSGLEEQPSEVHDSQEADGERGGSGSREGGEQQGRGIGSDIPPRRFGWRIRGF